MHAAAIPVQDHMTLRAIPRDGGGVVVACAKHGVLFDARGADGAAIAAIVVERIVPCPLCVADAFDCD